MSWTFSGERPIYTQLVEQLQLRIVRGEYAPGSRLDSVRDLANEAAVNPNTMQRAMAELEKQQLVFSQRTSGRFVTEDLDRIAGMREALAKDKITVFLQEMQMLGFKKGDLFELLHEGVMENE